METNVTAKIITVTCRNCKEKLSSNKIINIQRENHSIYVKKYYLKNIVFKSKQLLSPDSMYMFKKVKCISCKSKVGQLICLSKPEMKDRINSVALNEEAVDISEEEMSNVNVQLIKQTDAFYSSAKIDNKILDNFYFIVSYSKSNLKACAKGIQECVDALKVLVENVTYIRDTMTEFFTAIIEKKDKNAIQKFLAIDQIERIQKDDEAPPKQSLKRKSKPIKEENPKKKKGNKRKSKK